MSVYGGDLFVASEGDSMAFVGMSRDEGGYVWRISVKELEELDGAIITDRFDKNLKLVSRTVTYRRRAAAKDEDSNG